MDEGLNNTMFDNIGVKIQMVAKTVAWIEIILSVITGIVMFFYGVANFEYSGLYVLVGPVVGITGCIAAWLSAILLYGFGKLIEDVGEIRKGNISVESNRCGSSNYGNANYAYQQNANQTKPANNNSGSNDEISDGDEEFVDVYCPNCWEKLSFYKDEENPYCPNCNTKINIK